MTDYKRNEQISDIIVKVMDAQSKDRNNKDLSFIFRSLHRQIAKRPVYDKETDSYTCPGSFFYPSFKYALPMHSFKKHDYEWCPFCGQHLNWEPGSDYDMGDDLL